MWTDRRCSDEVPPRALANQHIYSVYRREIDLEKLDLQGIKVTPYYRRYVDDALTLMPDLSTAREFLYIFNHTHPASVYESQDCSGVPDRWTKASAHWSTMRCTSFQVWPVWCLLYVGYTRGHLFVRVDGHRSKAPSVCKHYDNRHAGTVPDDLRDCFKVLKKCQNMFDCLVIN